MVDARKRTTPAWCYTSTGPGPLKAVVFPLVVCAGRDGAQEIYPVPGAKSFMVDYDEAGSIGKRYRRQDEVGTRYCITVDFSG